MMNFKSTATRLAAISLASCAGLCVMAQIAAAETTQAPALVPNPFDATPAEELKTEKVHPSAPEAASPVPAAQPTVQPPAAESPQADKQAVKGKAPVAQKLTGKSVKKPVDVVIPVLHPIAPVPSAGAAASEESANPSHTWDWGGEKEVASSGKSVVAIDKQLATGSIIVSFQDRRLYLVTKSGEAMSYPIAIPRQQDDWQGALVVTEKKVNPSWTPTPAMIKENPKLPSWVPGGHPYNPLGVRALYLGSTAYRIHGTDAPWTIGEPVSKGCIRMYNNDVVDLYDRVPVGTKVTVTWTSYSSKVAQAKN
jgi:lipoprotein-anchoring transpeptidase ErfK/SrfK